MPNSIIHYALLTLSVTIIGGSLAPRVSSLSVLAGEWGIAKLALRNPDCCVVSVSGLEHHLRALQQEIVDKGLTDLDLRSRIRTGQTYVSNDCSRVLSSIVVKPHGVENSSIAASVAALEELASGVASLVEGSLKIDDVHMRVVCASEYRAMDPMFHTDKCPLRAYVTLCGVGTEIMTRPCSPIEYMSLRSLGKQPSGEPSDSVREAHELEFIVMKGDYYPQKVTTWLAKVWQRSYACVHRSPPGNGGRRVILSIDLADGDDDREWYDAGQKREWRSGMTQRKSRLVA